MSTLQNLNKAKPQAVSDKEAVNQELETRYQQHMLTVKQDEYITYKAMGGLMVNGDGDLVRTTTGDFASLLDTTRQTLHNWQKSIPNFWERVAERRKELGNQERLVKMHDTWYLSALMPGAKGFRDRQMWLANFDPNFKMPTQQVEHEVNVNYAGLLAAAAKDGVIDGEVVDDTNAIDAGPSTSDQSSHPQAS